MSSVRFLGAHNHSVNSADTADERTYGEADLLLQRARGPVALGLALDNHSLSSQTVTSVYELAPGQTPGLTASDQRALERAYAARGGRPADAAALAGSAAVNPVAAHAPRFAKVRVPRATVHTSSQLTCVEAAHGNLTKLEACTGR